MRARWSYSGAVVTVLSLVSATAFAKPDFREGFESGGLGTLTDGTNSGDGRVEIEEHDAADPPALGKFYVSGTMRGDERYNDVQRRMYIGTIRTDVQAGEDSFVSMYLLSKEAPKARDNFFYYESPGNKNVLTWWVVPNGKGGTNVVLGTGNLGERGEVWTADFEIGKWHQVATHIHWGRTNDTGSLTLWFDGVKVLDEHQVQTMEDGGSHHSHPGIHRDSTKTPAYFEGVDTLSFDNIITGRALEDVEVMDPRDASAGAGGAAGAGGVAATAGGAPVVAGAAAGPAASGSGGGNTAGATTSSSAGSSGAPVGGVGAATPPAAPADGGGCSLVASRRRGTSPLVVLLSLVALGLVARQGGCQPQVLFRRSRAGHATDSRA